MDVRSIEDAAPIVEHNGTVAVWWMIKPRETQEITAGGYRVRIPPGLVHSLRPVSDHAPIHCFCFAVGMAGAEPIDYTHH